MLGLCLVVFTGLVFIQTRPGQLWIRNLAVSYLEKKTGTRIVIGHIKLHWFSALSIKDIRVYDRRKVPLLYSAQLDLTFNLLPLLHHKLVIHELNWKNVLVNIYTQPDHQLNYQFLPDAFQPPDTDSNTSPFRFKIGRINLTSVKIRYAAAEQGIDAAAQLSRLVVQADEIDPSKGKYIFKDVMADGLKGFLTLTPASRNEKEHTDETPISLKFQAKRIRVSQSSFAYRDESSGFSTGWQWKDLTLRLPAADFSNHFINTGYISLNDPKGYVFLTSPRETQKAEITKKAPGSFRLLSPELNISRGSLRYENNQQKKSNYRNSFDFQHFHLNPVYLQVKEIKFSEGDLVARLKKLELVDRSGFRIRKANANILYTDRSIVLDGLFLETNESRIANRLALQAPSFSQDSLSISTIRLEASLINTKLKLSEALYFAPELRENPDLQKIWNRELLLNGQISGQVDSLSLNKLQLKDNAGNDIQLAGTIKQITQPDRMSLNLH